MFVELWGTFDTQTRKIVTNTNNESHSFKNTHLTTILPILRKIEPCKQQLIQKIVENLRLCVKKTSRFKCWDRLQNKQKTMSLD